ncbi:glycosyl transferase family 2 [Moorena producens PAL-8-15-08-1]|uniref:Glycosyl transferase family 2 n=1 Tax=Moorena producens PAL-8-15-08-1 TaxID=1458985 RepID=A0A1D8TTW3_9CYAN|nr:glycosyltransferase family 2 protein [Moorena producens]AOX00993.1 glycosyl transferase family 2 [Moorena producens PAL-8-15-08-1]
MSKPLLSIVIPTYNRPHLLPHAVNSALAQTLEDIEVIVIDDASTKLLHLPEHPRLKFVQLPKNRGISAVRNTGAKMARGKYLTYLDDDDQLLPHMAQVSLDALEKATLPQPVAVLSTMEVVNADGKVLRKRIPPTLPRGKHFFLEEIEPGQSFLSKQTLVVERKLLLEIGGYDESFSSREHTEMFLRLNPVCSLLGLPIVTYRQLKHEGPRLSRASSLRQVDFHRLIDKHNSLFRAHPKTFGNFVYEHSYRSYELGQKRAAFFSLLWAMRLAPRKIFPRFTSTLWNRVKVTR